MKLSLAMIVRDCAEDLKRCLQSVHQYVDDITILDTGSKDATKEVALGFGARVFEQEWKHDFAAARQESFDLALHDHVIWLDSDDTIPPDVAPTFFQQVRDILENQKVACCLVAYDYEFDQNGNCTTRLFRERVVDRRLFFWKSRIHECLCAKYNFQAAFIPANVGYVQHHRSQLDVDISRSKLERNLEIFTQMKEAGDFETRSHYYLGNTLNGLGRFSEAIQSYEAYCDQSDVINEVYSARCAQANCSLNMGEYDQAAYYAMQAVSLEPGLPTAYLMMALTMLNDRQNRRAMAFARECLSHKDNDRSEAVYNPHALRSKPHFILAYCLANEMKLDEAWQHIEESYRLIPYDQNVIELRNKIAATLQRNYLTQSFMALRAELEKEGREKEVSQLVMALPKSLEKEPEVLRVMPRMRVLGRPTLAIHCGSTVEPWGPSSIKTGVGGSEEAVINMARELALIGWHVEVYCHTDEPGTAENGVQYYPHWAWKGEDDEIDVTVWWRNPSGPIHAGSHSKLNYLWLHDMPTQAQWYPNHGEIFDKVMFLSDFHREQHPWVSDEQAMMTRNGIDLGICPPLSQLTNESHKLIYTSCPSRGLIVLLNWWAHIKERVPQAELHIYYGWRPLAQYRRTQDPLFNRLVKDIDLKKGQSGVHWWGSVGQKELNEMTASCGFWAYPTSFPEISCITAMKMQANGCWPVTVNRFALKETVAFGEKLDLDLNLVSDQKAYIDRLVALMKIGVTGADRRIMAAYARDRFPWSAVAQHWNREFKEKLGCSQAKRLIRKGSNQVHLLTA